MCKSLTEGCCDSVPVCGWQEAARPPTAPVPSASTPGGGSGRRALLGLSSESQRQSDAMAVLYVPSHWAKGAAIRFSSSSSLTHNLLQSDYLSNFVPVSTSNAIRYLFEVPTQFGTCIWLAGGGTSSHGSGPECAGKNLYYRTGLRACGLRFAFGVQG